MSSNTYKKIAQSLTAGALITGLLLTSLVAPSALAGGGSGGSDGTGGDGAATQLWIYKDDAEGSFGSATDYANITRALDMLNVEIINNGSGYDGPAKAKAALEEANKNCEDGFNQRHPNEVGQANCRVVAVGVAASLSGKWTGAHIYSQSTWLDNWNKYVAPNKYNYAGTREYVTSTAFADDPSNSVDKLMQQQVTDRGDGICPRSMVIIVLDKYQPAPLETPPAAPSKTVERGTSADSMRNRTTITSGTGVGGTVLDFRASKRRHAAERVA